jgi:hypothetical protein
VKTRWEIAEYWSKNWNSETAKFVVDLGEPSCFACGYYKQKWDESEDAKTCWNKTGLHRAHIVANNIGGADSPENYLLLCERCHIQAPMTNDPAIMIMWASKRESYWSAVDRAMRHEWAKYDIPNDLDLVGMPEFLVAIDNDGHLRGTDPLTKAPRLVALVDAYAHSKHNPRCNEIKQVIGDPIGVR